MIGVHILQIPEGGHKLIEGEEDAAFLDLSEIGARATEPVHYALEVGMSGGGVFATGRVTVPVEMTCVACLQPFVFEAVVDPFATQVEVEGREMVDLTPAVREEILLALPNHPRCDFISSHTCPFHQSAPIGGEPPTAESAWDQLDKLKLKR
jgi:uncharacterized metal-binding protein YceD (DUF177 family)